MTMSRCVGQYVAVAVATVMNATTAGSYTDFKVFRKILHVVLNYNKTKVTCADLLKFVCD